MNYPPLTGGMMATSSPGLIFPSANSTYSRFIATLTDDRIFLSFSFACRDSRIWNSSGIESEVDSTGNWTFSVANPVASFADAKYSILKVCFQS